MPDERSLPYRHPRLVHHHLADRRQVVLPVREEVAVMLTLLFGLRARSANTAVGTRDLLAELAATREADQATRLTAALRRRTR